MAITIMIREAEPGDADQIAGLSRQLGYETPVIITANNLAIINKNENEIVFVAVLDQKIVGWIQAFRATRLESSTFCEIGGLVVDSRHRGSGTGKLLIEQVKSWCMEKGIYSLRVRCNVKRKDAHQFYLRSGFRETKEQKVFEIDVSASNNG